MLSSSEIAQGSQGAIKFLSRDASALSHFDNTLESCLRSFRVMILTAPIYVLIRYIEYMDVRVEADIGLVCMVEAIRYVIEWLLYPVLFYEIARRRRWLDRYPRYVSALNWSALPQCILLLAADALAVLVPGVTAPVMLCLQLFFFYWFLAITRLGLGVTWGLATVLLIVNWVPSYFLSVLVNRVLGVSFLPG